MARTYVLLLAGLLGCADEGGGGPSSPYEANPGDADYCEPTLDAPTASGITGAQAFALYGGAFEVTLEERDWSQGDDVLATDTVSVQIELREDHEEDAANCAFVSLPVTVSLRGAIIELVADGVLVAGTGSIHFVGKDPNRLNGYIGVAGERSEVQLRLENSDWSSRSTP